MTDTKKTELFETMPIPSAVAKLCIPTVISSLVMVLYNLADTYFVGMIGISAESAAVTLAAPVILAFNALINLFGVGTSSAMSRALGRKEYDTVRRAASFGFWCALACAAALSVGCTVFRSPLLTLLGADAETAGPTAEYMLWTVTLGAVPAILNVVLANMVRSEGSSFHAAVGTMSGCILNIILDPVFIMPWGLDMAAAGAGCATFISNTVACAYFLVLLFVKRRETCVSVSPKYFGFRRDLVADVFSVGIPAAIQNLLNVTGMTVLNNFTSAFGTDAVTAMGITHKVNMVPMYITMGTGQGIMPLVGYNYASGNADRMKKAVTFTAKLMALFVIAATALFYVFSGEIIGLFMKNEAVVAYGRAFLRGFCLGLPFLALDFLAVGIFQAVGMGKESLIFAILRKVALEIPALYILNRLFPLYGLAYSQLAAEAVLAVAAVIVLARLFKRVERESASPK